MLPFYLYPYVIGIARVITVNNLFGLKPDHECTKCSFVKRWVVAAPQGTKFYICGSSTDFNAAYLDFFIATSEIIIRCRPYKIRIK